MILASKKDVTMECYFDDEDWEKINIYSWTLKYNVANHGWYAKATKQLGNQKTENIYMNRYVMGLEFKDGKKVDHINHNTLDNRKSNLRVVTQRQNLTHRIGKNSNNTSGYRNVSKIGKYWKVQLQIDGEHVMFKENFDDVDDAGRFAQEMRELYYGEYAGNA